MAKYEVINGMFKGLKFNGSPIVINEEPRIWNDDSTGQAFLVENCIEMEESLFIPSLYYCKLVNVTTNKPIFKFSSYMGARQSLLKMGFKDSVHKSILNGDKWTYKGREYSLIQY